MGIVIVVMIVLIGLGTITVLLMRRSTFMPIELFFKSHADYKEFTSRLDKFKALEKEYFQGLDTVKVADALSTFRKIGLDSVADAYEKKKRSCLRLIPGEATQKPFSSRIGGLPDLPEPGLWPKYKGKSQAFIAQVNLGELPREGLDLPLPANGMLYFFYDAEQSTWGFDPKDKGSWAVIYVDNLPDRPVEIGYPDDLVEQARYESVSVSPEVTESIPDTSVIFEGMSLTEEQEYQAIDVYSQFVEGHGPLHQLLGYAAPIQNPMEIECQLVSHGIYLGDGDGYESPRAKELAAYASQWRLLLQVDSDENAGMMWGDAGRLYFWITEDDLRNRRFENTWMILQCG